MGIANRAAMQLSWLLLLVPGPIAGLAGGDKNSRCPREIGINIQPKRNGGCKRITKQIREGEK